MEKQRLRTWKKKYDINRRGVYGSPEREEYNRIECARKRYIRLITRLYCALKENGLVGSQSCHIELIW